MNSLAAAAAILAAWGVWLHARLRFSALGRARREFWSAAQQLDSDHMWLSHDRAAVFSRTDRRAAGVRVLMVTRYPTEDLRAARRAGSAPVHTCSYRLLAGFPHVLRRDDADTHTSAGERIGQAGTLRDTASLLRQIRARTLCPTPAELTGLAAELRSTSRAARKSLR